jgi:hypothetical protein
MAPYASHLFFTQFLDDTNPDHRALGIEAGFCFAKDSEYRLFFTDLGISAGMERGRVEAISLGQIIQEHTLPELYLNQLDSNNPIGAPTEGF